MGLPLSCPVVVGREAERAQLRESVKAVAEGRGRVVLVTGEAGIGKSRLLTDTLTGPEASKCVQVRAACLEPDRSEPYALVLELAHVATGGVVNLPIGGAPEAERQVRRVQQALRELLARAGGQRPVILVAEDLHWSDAPSLDVLLGFVQRSGGMLVVLTCRSKHPSPALSGFLSDLNRLRTVHEISLKPLRHAEVARMIRAIARLDGPLSGGLLNEVMTATDGNPFLVEEVVHSLVESGELDRTTARSWRRRSGELPRVPGSLQQSMEARLSTLTPMEVDIAVLAAMLGQVIDVAPLLRLAKADEPTLLAALRRLTDEQIIEERPDGALAFRHALSREAVLARLLEPERRALHRRIAERLAVESGVSPATLAYHWAAAGALTRAAPHALRAADQAVAMHAHREALAHYEVALGSQVEPAAALLTAIGDQHAALGECDPAVARYGEALAVAAAEGAESATAELHLRIGLAYGADRRRPDAQRHLAVAFRELPSEHPDAWRAGLHLALQFGSSGDYPRAKATLGETLQMAVRSVGGALPRLRVEYELGGLQALGGDWAALERAGTTVLREASEADDAALGLCHDAHAALGTIAYYRGTFTDAVTHFTACLRLGERRGVVADQALARWNLATNALYHLGRWQEARQELSELQALGMASLEETGKWFELWLDGRWEEGLALWLHGWSEMEASADIEVLQAHGRRIADILLALGQPEEALSFLTGVLVRVRAIGARSFESQLAPREAEAMARLVHPNAAASCEAGLDLARALGARPAEALLLRARGLVQRNSQRWSEAFNDWDEAVEMLDALSMPFEAAKTMREAGLGRLARGRRGDRERGAEHLRTARRIFADLGATRDEAATGAILSAAGLAGRTERGPGPLSPREREVAELVASGCSNREIADRLFITEKTAAYHVGAILNKLGFNSRSQIAAYVARHDAEIAGRS